MKDSTYKDIIIESIKCHHQDITEYIMTYYEKKTKISIIQNCLKFYNFLLLDDKFDDFLANVNENMFYLCKYDYFVLVDILLKEGKIDINRKMKFKSLQTIQSIHNEFLNNDDLFFMDDSKEINTEANLLYFATKKGNKEIVELLVKLPEIDINLPSTIEVYNKMNNGKDLITTTISPLHIAIENEDAELIKTLLAHKSIDLNVKSIVEDVNMFNFSKKCCVEKKSALTSVIRQNNYDIVKLLLENPNIDINSKEIIEVSENNKKSIKENPALLIAVQNKNYQIVKLLLSRNELDVNLKCLEYTYNLDQKGNIINNKENIVNEQTAMYIAMKQSDIEMIKLLLSRNDIDINGKMKTVECDFYFEENDYYDEYSSKIFREETILYMAVDAQSYDIVNILLINENIDVNVLSTISYCDYIDNEITEESIKSNTALHLAVINEDLEMIKILLKCKNINLNIENGERQKPIELSKNDDIKFLLQHHNQ